MMITRSLTAAGLGFLSLGLLFSEASTAGITAPGFAGDVVSENGTIRVPDNFRTDYVMLGAWSVGSDTDTDSADGNGIGMHVVYTTREAVEAYRQTGHFPDGAVIVKELFNTQTESLTTGEASSVTDTVGYFVMVKDAKGRFPDNALWGDGWGWSFFGADDTRNTVTANYKGECIDCHLPAEASDYIYDYAYPVLKK